MLRIEDWIVIPGYNKLDQMAAPDESKGDKQIIGYIYGQDGKLERWVKTSIVKGQRDGVMQLQLNSAGPYIDCTAG